MANIRSRGGWKANESAHIEVFVGDCFDVEELPPPEKTFADMLKDIESNIHDYTYNLPYTYHIRRDRPREAYNHIIQLQNPNSWLLQNMEGLEE